MDDLTEPTLGVHRAVAGIAPGRTGGAKPGALLAGWAPAPACAVTHREQARAG